MMRKKFIQHSPSFAISKRIHKVLSSEKVMLNGRVVSQSVWIEEDMDKEFEHLFADDFRLENQLANGVELKECTPLKMSVLELSDELVAGILFENGKLLNLKKIDENGKENSVSSDSRKESDAVSE